MKKSMYLFIIGLVLTVSNSVFGQNNLNFRPLDLPLLATFKNQYKKDPMVQAILNKDLKNIKKLSVNSKTQLIIEIIDKGKFKVIFKCNYIGLAGLACYLNIYDRLMVKEFSNYNQEKPNYKFIAFEKKEIDYLYSVINILNNKKVSIKENCICTSYYKHRGKWKVYFVYSDHGIFRSNWVKNFIDDFKEKNWSLFFFNMSVF